jgi:Tol biopolymer transport system component/regulation of enolase protein 1 (concanavalin A-like superfamily)
MKDIVMSALLIASVAGSPAFGQTGIFSNQQDVGPVAGPGSADFNPSTGQYRVAGGGNTLWRTNDAFHFVWVKMSGDFTLAANLHFPIPGGNPHHQAGLMIRQSLDADSACADVAVQGSGLTTLQYRDAPGEATREIQLAVSAPERVRLEKHGAYVSLSCSATNGPLQPAGAMCRLPFQEPFYVGLAVSASDHQTIEPVEFSKVELQTVPPGNQPPAVESTLETISLNTIRRQVVYHSAGHFEAPNWSPDGKYFYFNSGGRIYRLPVTGGTPQMLDTGLAIACNNDHGISPDGTQYAVSDTSQGDKISRVYVLPIGGGAARLITPLGPSYWHGWSPDGKTLAYCAQRNGDFDVYTIPAAGGAETRLTTAPGLDDGPDYSPDGKYIYFNSVRSGLMQIWRMKSDGAGQEQITTDNYNNWFAHPSPDGRWIVFLSYDPAVTGHPPNQDVSLRLMSLASGKIQVLAKLFGGQGTINVPSWSPDSKTIAFVSYQMVYP